MDDTPRRLQTDEIGQVLDAEGKPVEPGSFVDIDGKPAEPSDGPRIRVTKAQAEYLMSLPLKEREKVAMHLLRLRSEKYLKQKKQKRLRDLEKQHKKSRKVERQRRKRGRK